MVAEAYQGDVGFQLYEATRGARTIRVVEQLTVRDGRIASSVFVTDLAAFTGSSAPHEPEPRRGPVVRTGRPSLDATMRRARDIILRQTAG
jgi:hypothetical protein